MLHFRTLDWGMDFLRSIVVQLDFIRSKSDTPQQILASSITYVGFVGVLTGVRQDLSISLNFRGVHNAVTRYEQFRFYVHHVLVLLGVKQSISSLLRSYLVGRRSSRTPTLALLASEVPSKHSTAAYLMFSDGKSAVTMEKDYNTAVTRRSECFIVTTNHDLTFSPNAGMHEDSTRTEVTSFADVLSESHSWRSSITKKWDAKVRREERRKRKSGSRRKVREEDTMAVELSVSLTTKEIIQWVSAWPTTNESTHFAAVLDPSTGKVLWVERYPPLLKNLERGCL